MKRRWFVVLFVPATTFIVMSACSDDDNSSTSPKPDGGAELQNPFDTGVRWDAADAAALAKPTVVLIADGASGELAEGLTVLPADSGATHAGEPVIGYAPLGKLVTLQRDGGTQSHAQATGVNNTFTNGLNVDSVGNVYMAVGAAM